MHHNWHIQDKYKEHKQEEKQKDVPKTQQNTYTTKTSILGKEERLRHISVVKLHTTTTAR
jgi:hypothetical protein